jgi:hypothetical protein
VERDGLEEFHISFLGGFDLLDRNSTAEPRMAIPEELNQQSHERIMAGNAKPATYA